MGRKNKTVPTTEEINKLVEERMKEYEKQHTAWVVLGYGNTYVGYDMCDHITQNLMVYVIKLMELMHVSYSIKCPFGDDREYYLVLEGEDKARADFIQRFFDNGYKLNW